MPKDKYILS